jgi:hypothetical protein
MSSYCTQTDVYRWIPRGSVQNPAPLVSDVNTTTDVMSLDGHGFADDDELIFRAESGGTLPTGIVAGTTYYAIVVTDATFSVAATAGGSAINLSGSGTNFSVGIQAPWAAWIVDASGEIDNTLPAHVVPLSAPYPPVVVSYAAGLVAEMALAWSGVVSNGLNDRMVRVRSEVALWRKNGLPMRGTNAPSNSANMAISAGSTSVDPRGWDGDDSTRIP